MVLLEWGSRFNARMGFAIARKVCQVMSKHILNRNRDSISKELKKYLFKRVVAQVSENDRFALYLGIQVDLMLEWGS
ncbi:uncharacterized protein G2W53_028879 [Senna tora]|uniref:Uncharacterized protein n=1 Tax=Senna tora TaxID=362788 RepID=A0A834W969_9FABA|nr:uncharacterized protein G2W53_028879 [Senna tora]